MTEQEENELICEKLLGWEKHIPKDGVWGGDWLCPLETWMKGGTPTFTDWASAGLILEALAAKGLPFDLYQDGDWTVGFYAKKHARLAIGRIPNSATGPLAIRAAALAYIRSL